MKSRLDVLMTHIMYHFKALNKTQGSVTYFVNIQKSMAKGDTTELLVNYKVRFTSSLDSLLA